MRPQPPFSLHYDPPHSREIVVRGIDYAMENQFAAVAHLRDVPIRED